MVFAYRNETNGAIVFLLENWWEGRYLVEVVSTKYLASTCATVVFLPKDVKVEVDATMDFIADAADAQYAEADTPQSVLPCIRYVILM
jgi:hypothetical protein